MEGTLRAHGEVSCASLDIPIKKVTGLNLQSAHDTLAVEEPLEIQLGYGATDARVVKSIRMSAQFAERSPSSLAIQSSACFEGRS
jgi:hypothetical protein